MDGHATELLVPLVSRRQKMKARKEVPRVVEKSAREKSFCVRMQRAGMSSLRGRPITNVRTEILSAGG